MIKDRYGVNYLPYAYTDQFAYYMDFSGENEEQLWMEMRFPNCPWERYADDELIHCVSRKQAEFVFDMLNPQMFCHWKMGYMPVY